MNADRAAWRTAVAAIAAVVVTGAVAIVITLWLTKSPPMVPCADVWNAAGQPVHQWCQGPAGVTP